MPEGRLFEFPRDSADPLLAYIPTVRPVEPVSTSKGEPGHNDVSYMGGYFTQRNSSPPVNANPEDRRPDLADEVKVINVNEELGQVTLTFSKGRNRSPVFAGEDANNIYDGMETAAEQLTGSPEFKIISYKYQTYAEGTFGGRRPLIKSPLVYTLTIPGTYSGEKHREAAVEAPPEVGTLSVNEPRGQTEITMQMKNDRVTGWEMVGVNDAIGDVYGLEPGEMISEYKYEAK